LYEEVIEYAMILYVFIVNILLYSSYITF